MTQHEVKLDGAGIFNSHSRLTCYGCASATLVRPDLRRRGLGSVLLLTAIGEARRRELLATML